MKKISGKTAQKKKTFWKKALMYGVPASAIAIGLYYILKGNSANTTTPPDTTEPPVGGNCASTGTAAFLPLKLYSGYTGTTCESDAVKKLQTYLNKSAKVNPKLSVDGKFGTLTQAAVIAVFGHSTINAADYSVVTGSSFNVPLQGISL